MKQKLSKFYNAFYPAIWTMFGVSAAFFTFGYDLPTLDINTLFLGDSEYKTSDGRFACWWIEDVMSEKGFEDNSDFIKELFQLHLKHCEDIPRP